MADHLIQCSIFSVKHDGAFDFSINQVFSVNKPVTKILEIATSGNTGLNFVYCLWALSSASVIVYSCNLNNVDKFFKKIPKIANLSKKLFTQNFWSIEKWKTPSYSKLKTLHPIRWSAILIFSGVPHNC